MITFKNIDDFKNDFKNMKASDMETSIFADKKESFDSILKIIKAQDKDDERYLLRKRILPVLIGIIIFSIIMMFITVSNILLFTGCTMIYAGLIAVLVLFFRDYRNISKEASGLNLLNYLENKVRRLKSWKSNPKLYHFLYGIYIIGVLLIIIGNIKPIDILKTTQNFIIYTAGIIISLIISGIIGEILYRKRYIKKHQPLIDSISALISELKANGE
jgi:hypothetical protein